MTTTRNLIRRLADELTNAIRVIHNEDGTQHISTAAPVLDEARAYLSQPEPEELTDEELGAIAGAAEIQYMKEHGGLTASTGDGIHAQLRAQRIAGLRAVAARCSRPAIEPEPEYPSDKELLELMPEKMRNEFSCIAKLYSDATGGHVEPGIFRVALNTAALEYAQAVLARYASILYKTITQENN